MSEEQNNSESQSDGSSSIDYPGLLADAQAQGNQEPSPDRAQAMATAESPHVMIAKEIRGLPDTEPQRDEMAAQAELDASRAGEAAGIKFDQENAGLQEPNSERTHVRAAAADEHMTRAAQLSAESQAQQDLRDQSATRGGPMLESMFRFFREDVLRWRADRHRKAAERAADRAGDEYDKSQEKS